MISGLSLVRVWAEGLFAAVIAFRNAGLYASRAFHLDKPQGVRERVRSVHDGGLVLLQRRPSFFCGHGGADHAPLVEALLCADMERAGLDRPFLVSAATTALGESLFTGGKVMLEGDVARGFEMMAPKAVRDLMKSYRYANEGLTTLRGDEVMSADQMSVHDIVAQAIGFTPAAVAETWERNRALKNADRAVRENRQRLVNKWAMAMKTG